MVIISGVCANVSENEGNGGRDNEHLNHEVVEEFDKDGAERFCSERFPIVASKEV